jgi:hypothetical protein
MSLRPLLIKVMLWALGATAVIGAIAALSGVGDNGWRIVGTGLITAVTAGLMLPFSFLADKPKSRREGLLGMTLVVIEFGAALGLVWKVFESMGSYRLEDNIGATMFFLAITALPAILFLRFASMKAPRIAGIAGVILATLVFAALMIGTWSGDLWYNNDKWFATAGACSAIGILAVASLAGVGTQPFRWWRWLGVIASLIAIAGGLYSIWMDVNSGGGLFAVIISIAAVVAHANLCLFVPLTPGQKWVRVVTILFAIAAAALVDVLALQEDYKFDFPMAENLAAASGIIASCGSLALLVLARINRNLDRVPVLSELKELTLFCPGCHKKQTMSVGDSACTTCGLKIHVRLEEPRCPKCDYLLFMLQSDRCPECGTIVNQMIAT